MVHRSSSIGKPRWIIAIVILIVLSLAVTPLSAAEPKKEKDEKRNGNKPEVPPVVRGVKTFGDILRNGNKPEVPPGHSDNFLGNGHGPPQTPPGQEGKQDQPPQLEIPPQENEAPQPKNELPISEPDNSAEGPQDQPSEDNIVEEPTVEENVEEPPVEEEAPHVEENVAEEPAAEENVPEPEPEVAPEPVIEVQPVAQPAPAVSQPAVQYQVSSKYVAEVETASALADAVQEDNLEDEVQVKESPAPEPVAVTPVLGEAQSVAGQNKESSAPESSQASPLVIQISGGTAVVFAIMSVLMIIRTLHGGIVRQTTPVRLEQLGSVHVTAVHGILRKVKPVSVKGKFARKSKIGKREVLRILAGNSGPSGLRRGR
ncbi:MAG: hypothetical protein AB1305_00865 [Candidatus Hadarchaeota archaeon]